MKKKSVFRKIAFLLTITILLQLCVLDFTKIHSKAADEVITSKDSSYTISNAGFSFYEVNDVVTINGDFTVNGSAFLLSGVVITVNPGAVLNVNGNLNCNSTIINNGTINVTGNCSINTGNYYAKLENNGDLFIGGNIATNPFTQPGLYGSQPQGPYNSYLYNYGNLSITTTPDPDTIYSDSTGTIKVGSVVYLNELATIDASTISSVDSSKYKERAYVRAPQGWKISFDTDYSSSRNTIEVLESQPERDYYLFNSSGERTAAKKLPAITIRTTADEPTGTPYVITNPGSKVGNFYWTYVGVKPAAGYTELDFYIGDDAQFSATQSSEHPFFSTTRGAYRVRLKDADGFYTNFYDLEDLNIIPGNIEPYVVTGDFFDEIDNGNVYATAAKIQGREGYKVILAEDYQANNNAAGSDEINITKTKRNIKIYLKASGDNVWLGPIELGDIVIGLETPSNPYTISGKKYKDKFYESDVEITPAEGYKISTSKDGKNVADKLKFTKTTKNVTIYLAKESADSEPANKKYAYSDPISIGDIYILREGEGKVTVNDLYYGGKVIPVVSTKTNDIKKVSYKYKKADGGDYLKEVPSEIGKYVVEATFEMTEDYKELVVKDDFEISYLPAPKTPYTLEGTLGDNNIYTSDVKIIPAEGYKISKTIKTGYADSISVDKNADTGYIYLQKTSTGEMTDKIAIKDILIDKEKPVVTGISNNEVIYTDSKQIVVKDENLFEVSVNGVKVAVSDGQAVIDLSADNGIMDYTIIMKDKAGNTSTIYVTLITAWMQSGDVQEGVPLKLYPGYTYNFPEGSTWTIEGDPTVYCGGNKFVVTNNVEIKFKKG